MKKEKIKFTKKEKEWILEIIEDLMSSDFFSAEYKHNKKSRLDWTKPEYWHVGEEDGITKTEFNLRKSIWHKLKKKYLDDVVAKQSASKP